MKWYSVILYLFLFLKTIYGANILAVFPFPAPSHFAMFGKLVRGLAERGHQVDVMSHFPLKEPMEGYNDISLVGTQSNFRRNMTVDFIKQLDGIRIISFYFMLKMVGTNVCQATFNSDVAKTVRNSSKKYDLVITEAFATDCMLGWGHHFGVPVVVLSSSVGLPWFNDRFGNPDNPSYIANIYSEVLPRPTLYDRVINTYHNLLSKFMYKFFSERPSNELAKEFFGQDMPDLSDLTYNISLILLNSHFSIDQARPTVPNYVEVGGLHMDEPKPLNKYFQDLLKTDTKGIIYFSMGSLVLVESFEVEKIQAMVDALAELPYKVIWKANKELFPKEVKYPKNIYFEKWMPQFDILCHPNVKLFISHGGLLGTQEAVYCGVPRLGIPFYGDQKWNIMQSENLGIAKKVGYADITKESFLEALTELLDNPKYQENAKLISEQFRDRPMSALDTALYWTEYVIKHKGAPHLRSVGRELPWYQYHLLDVGLILVLAPLILCYLLSYIIKLLFNRKSQKSKKD